MPTQEEVEKNVREAVEAAKRALDEQLLKEHEAGYTIVRSPLPQMTGCHCCGALEIEAFSPLFERDANTKRSYMHVAVVCGACKADETKIQALGDRIVAHGQKLYDTYGDAVVVKPAESTKGQA